MIGVLVWLALCGCGDDGGPAPGVPDAAVPDAASAGLAAQLEAIDGVLAVTERTTSKPGYRRFELVIDQPVDHTAPGASGPRFMQQVTLMHRDPDAPMVLTSTGYDNYLGDTLSEPTTLLRGNQLAVEHRYFGESRPQPPDWSYLTVAQAAADHHRVVTLLRPLYAADWVSTGLSKGGMTAILHRRFYPDDVTATIAYVAPLSLAVGDERYHDFFAGLEPDPDGCPARVREFQRQALERRDSLEAVIASDLSGSSFARVGGIGPALEYGVYEFEWTFWQYLGSARCDEVPGASASDRVYADFLATVDAVGALSDSSLERFGPYYYQSVIELGYPSIPAAHLDDLARYDYDAALFELIPEGAEAGPSSYQPSAMRDVIDWIERDAERMVFLYGAQDPWTAGAVQLDPMTAAARGLHVVVAPDSNHRSKIGDLTSADQNLVTAALTGWVESAGALGIAAQAAPSELAGPRPGYGLRPR